MIGAINKNLLALVENHEAAGRKSKICLEGSSRSGKTWSWIEYIINCSVQMPGLISTAFRHDATTHDKAGARDFQRIMQEIFLSEWLAGQWNKTSKTFTFKNGSIFEFAGTNDAGRLHGPERDIAILNEAMEITYEAYQQISKRTRLMEIFDWNPSLSCHWVFDRILKQDDVLYVHSTYKDNPHLTAKQIQSIECTDPTNPENVRQGTANQWQWDVYGLGKRGRREGAIYPFFEVVDKWPDRMLCERWGFGLDFGYSEDPAALVECALFQCKLYLREWFYEAGLITCISHAKPNTPSIQGKLVAAGFQKDWKIVADSARPEQIAELVTEGFNVKAATKGAGSIVAGIDLMNRFPICVHRSSNNLQMELQQYAWKKHADGSWLAVPEDKWNHGLDGARYWAQEELPGMNFRRREGRTKQGWKRKRY